MTADWSYGTAGDEIPVKPGEIWTVGKNLFSCGDLEKGAGLALLAYAKGQPDFVYTDPPWNAGNAKAFRTKAGMPAPVDFDNLLQRVIEVLKTSQGYACCEMGVQWTQLLKQKIEDAGGTVLKDYGITYYRTKPCRLVVATWAGLPSPEIDLNNVDDDFTPLLAIEALCPKGGVVYDCCVGRGLTATSSVSSGRIAFGNELNPRRLAVTLKKLSGLIGQQPVKAGELNE